MTEFFFHIEIGRAQSLVPMPPSPPPPPENGESSCTRDAPGYPVRKEHAHLSLPPFSGDAQPTKTRMPKRQAREEREAVTPSSPSRCQSTHSYPPPARI